MCLIVALKMAAFQLGALGWPFTKQLSLKCLIVYASFNAVKSPDFKLVITARIRQSSAHELKRHSASSSDAGQISENMLAVYVYVFREENVTGSE